MDANHAHLKLEFGRLRDHHGTCADCNLLVRPVSVAVATSGSLAAYAMAPVGSALTRAVLSKQGGPSVDEVVRALQRLHVHAGGIVHGDPRLANLIWVDQGLMWIDLVGSTIGVSGDGGRAVLFQRDARCLAVSVLNLPPDCGRLPASVESAVEVYDPAEASAVSALSTALTSAFCDSSAS